MSAGRGTARAAVQRGARHVDVLEVDLPVEIADDEALVRVEGCGICGTDYEQYCGHLDDTGLADYPLVIGHEPVVRIEEIGADAERRWGVAAGDRVAVEPHSGCGVCPQCTAGRQVLCRSKLMYGYVPLRTGHGLWGGLASHMVLRGNSVLHRLPDAMPIEDALLFNPLGAGFEWAVDLGGVRIGQDVLIMGAGQRGLACVVASVMAGARRITVTGLARDEAKLEIARSVGADEVVVTDPDDPSSLLGIVGSNAFDCVIDVTPRATRPVLDAIAAVRPGGTVVVAGIKGPNAVPGFATDDLLFKSITLKGALGVKSPSYARAVQVLLDGRFDFAPWHTHTLRIDQTDRALRLLGGEDDGNGTPIHITVTP